MYKYIVVYSLIASAIMGCSKNEREILGVGAGIDVDGAGAGVDVSGSGVRAGVGNRENAPEPVDPPPEERVDPNPSDSPQDDETNPNPACSSQDDDQ